MSLFHCRILSKLTSSGLNLKFCALTRQGLLWGKDDTSDEPGRGELEAVQ